MTLAQLMYFMEIVKTKSFTEAANNLYVSQSSLSYAIRELEAELDVPLFIRRPNRKIEPSIYGETLYPYVADGIRLIEDGKNHIVSMKSPLHGKIRLAFFHSIVFTVVPALLTCFKNDNPGNKIEFQMLVSHNWVNFSQLLLDGKCDLVLSAGNIGNGCESAKIAEHRIFLIVPCNHPLADKDCVSLDILKDEQLILIDANSNMDLRIKEMLKAEGITPKVQYEADWTAQQFAVVNGQGLALSCDVALDERYVRKIPIDHALAVMPLYLTWANNRKLTGATLYVRDYFLQLAEKRGAELLF